MRGFSYYYVDSNDSGDWFFSDDGQSFLRTAAELNQIVSIHLPVALQPVLGSSPSSSATPRSCATAWAILWLPRVRMGPRCAPSSSRLMSRKSTSSFPAFTIRHLSAGSIRTPTPAILCALYDAYGPERLHWGSDYPVVRWAMTYRQALEVIRTRAADIILANDMERVLGSSLNELLTRHGTRA